MSSAAKIRPPTRCRTASPHCSGWKRRCSCRPAPCATRSRWPSIAGPAMRSSRPTMRTSSPSREAAGRRSPARRGAPCRTSTAFSRALPSMPRCAIPACATARDPAWWLSNRHRIWAAAPSGRWLASCGAHMKAWLRHHAQAVRQAFAHVRQAPAGFAMNTLVIAIAFALPLMGLTLLENLRPLTGRVAVEPEISVFLDNQTSRADAIALQARISQVLTAAQHPGRIEFLPREAALQQMKQQAGLAEAIAILGDNPLPDGYLIRLPSFRSAAAAASGSDGSRRPGSRAARSGLAARRSGRRGRDPGLGAVQRIQARSTSSIATFQ